MKARILPLVVSGIQIGAALLALGGPDWAQLAAFITGRVPAQGPAIAGMQVLLWIVVLAVSAAGLQQAARTTRLRPARHIWGGAVLAAGVGLLLAGAAHRLDPAPITMAGGSLQEARQEVAR
jgi:hypothetical protein